jgi:hypothetical protein
MIFGWAAMRLRVAGEGWGVAAGNDPGAAARCGSGRCVGVGEMLPTPGSAGLRRSTI